MLKIKNLSTTDEIIFSNLNKRLAPEEEYELTEDIRHDWAYDDDVISAISNSEVAILLNDEQISGISNQISYLRKEEINTHVKETTPFAKPEYRTKHAKNPSIITISPDTSETIDYQLTAERYISGGKVMVNNAEIGDYVTAEIYDKDGVIPAELRSSLCENWPTVARYIDGKWIDPNCLMNEIDTYPLNAKISAGLYLRVTYYATSSGSDRKCGINYYLTKKL